MQKYALRPESLPLFRLLLAESCTPPLIPEKRGKRKMLGGNELLLTAYSYSNVVGTLSWTIVGFWTWCLRWLERP